MATLQAALKSEVRSAIAGEVRKVLRPVRKLLLQVKVLKRAARDQRRNLASVEARLDRLKARVALRRSRSGLGATDVQIDDAGRMPSRNLPAVDIALEVSGVSE